MDKFRILEIVCSDEENNISLESLLKRHGISRRLITALKRISLGITRDDILCKTIDTVFAGDKICLKIPQSTEKGEVLEPQRDIFVAALYDDEDYVVFDKPSGMPVHQSIGHRTDTLANVFAAKYQGLPMRAVNRLDRDTSGLCLAAKNKCSANICADKIEKVYFAVCEGVIVQPIRIDAPIAREEESLIKRVVREDGKYAVTNVIPIKNNGRFTLLEIHLETGRTHQIRVHLSHIGHVLAGDELYGGSTELIKRQALHCGKMRFYHPILHEEIIVNSQLPCDMVNLFK